MKRMNLIHSVLVALFAFMGSVSLSAQNFYPNPQAAGVVIAEMTVLSSPNTTKGAQATFSQTSSGLVVQSPVVNAANLVPLKLAVLEMIILQLKQGVPTGDAIENVFSQLSQMSGANQGDRATQLNTVKNYIIDLLS